MSFTPRIGREGVSGRLWAYFTPSPFLCDLLADSPMRAQLQEAMELFYSSPRGQRSEHSDNGRFRFFLPFFYFRFLHGFLLCDRVDLNFTLLRTGLVEVLAKLRLT